MIVIGASFAVSLVLCGIGIIASFSLPRGRVPWLLAGFGTLTSLALLISGVAGLLAIGTFRISLWSLPFVGSLTITIDRLSAMFLIVTGLVALPASIFAASYTNTYQSKSPQFFTALYLALLAAISLVFTAGDVFLFLVSWEMMSILIYLLISGGGEERPGYLMLAVGEAGTLAVLMAFLMLAGNSGSLTFASLRENGPGLTASLRWTVFALSFFGFGVKAGLVPVNFWLPAAYRAAPAPLIPLLAGVTLNLGFYGIIRVNSDLLPITLIGPGLIVLGIGTITALIGILYATIEDDLKTLLAHSSIENVGIITVALGAGSLFVASGHPTSAAIAFIAALYHLLNHSIYKSLLFMGAEDVGHASGTFSLDRLGGLIKHMPWTTLFIMIGVLSIAAMPPFNGFVSEWLILQSLLRSVELLPLGVKIAFALAGAGLALTAGLAVTCFVRAFSMGFLGMARSKEANNAREMGKASLASMSFLAFACLATGVLPSYIIPTVDRVVAPIMGASATEALVAPFFLANPSAARLPTEFAAEFHDLGAQVGKGMVPGLGLTIIHRGGKENPVVFAMSTSYMLIALLVLFGLTISVVWLVAARRRRVERRPRWDGGVRVFLPEMTYTATGFAQPVRVLFEAILRPETVEESQEAIAEHFRMVIRKESKEVHLIDRLVFRPLATAALWIANRVASMHNGQLNAYATYALLVLILFLTIASLP